MSEAPTPAIAWLVILPVIIPLIAGAFAVMMRRLVYHQHLIGLGGVLALVVVNVMLLAHVLANGPLSMTMGNWLPPFGISFAADTLSALMALVGSLIGLLAAIYALDDIGMRGRRFGFFPLLMIMLAGVNGAFLTGDIFNLYVWLEVLLISSFGLLILGGERMQIDGAVKYAFLNLIATTLFLVATGLLYGLTGTLNLADLGRILPGHAADDLLAVVALLYLVALGMKGAVFPLFFWLPASYHTPRFVVSALFAGLLTKVAIYALFRIFTLVFAEAPEAVYQIMLWAAIATMVIGAAGALAQNELRRMLGYMVIGGIGSIVLGLALGSPNGIAGGIFYMTHSMIVMTALYLLAGALAQLTGSESFAKAGGVYGASPLLAGMFLVLGFAVAGLPPFSGFWPKVVLVRESLDQGLGWAAGAVLLNGFLTVLAVSKVWRSVFLRGGPEGTPDGVVAMEPEAGAAAVRPVVIGPILVLGLAATVIGLVPTLVMPLALEASQSLLDPAAYVEAVLGARP